MKVIEVLELYRDKGYQFNVSQHSSNTMLITHNRMTNEEQGIRISVIDRNGYTVSVNGIKDILKRDVRETYIRSSYKINNIQYIKPSVEQFKDLIDSNSYKNFEDIMQSLKL